MKNEEKIGLILGIIGMSLMDPILDYFINLFFGAIAIIGFTIYILYGSNQTEKKVKE